MSERIVSAAKLVAYERWQAPDLDAVENEFQPSGEEMEADGPQESEPAMEPEGLEYEQIRAMRSRAWDEGWQAGHEEGRAVAAREAERQLDCVRALVEALKKPLDNLDEAVEEELVALSVEIGKRLVRRELKHVRGEIVAVIREAVEMLPLSKQEIDVFVHGEDASFLRDALELDGVDCRLRLHEDPTVAQGGCRVVCGMASVDATVERRLAGIVAAAFGDERSSLGGN